MNFCTFMVLGIGLLCSAPDKQVTAIDTTCQAFEPIRWSRRDTDKTIRQAKEHNAAWVRLCGGDQSR